MRAIACLLLLSSQAIGGPPRDLPTVTMQLGGKTYTFGRGIETSVEGMVRAVLGSCCAEVGDDEENRKRYEKLLKENHIRILYANPRTMTANVEKEIVVATELVFGENGQLIVRNGEHYRALTKYSPDYSLLLRKQMRELPRK